MKSVQIGQIALAALVSAIVSATLTGTLPASMRRSLPSAVEMPRKADMPQKPAVVSNPEPSSPGPKQPHVLTQAEYLEILANFECVRMGSRCRVYVQTDGSSAKCRLKKAGTECPDSVNPKPYILLNVVSEDPSMARQQVTDALFAFALTAVPWRLQAVGQRLGQPPSPSFDWTSQVVIVQDLTKHFTTKPGAVRRARVVLGDETGTPDPPRSREQVYDRIA
jgi:hypothetical protein